MQENLEQFADNVFRFALSLTRDRHLAEDLSQECFLRAHRSRHQLDKPEAVKGWLFRILLNLWKDHFKKNRNLLSQTPVDQIGSNALTPDQELVQRERCQHVMAVMQSLPTQQRNVLFLHSIEGFSNQEIADLLETSLGGVKANLSIARKTMRTKLREPAKQLKEQS